MNDSKIIPILIFCLILWTIFLIPFKILSYGYMPADDAMRHTAKAVSGKPWGEILVLRDDIKMDSHPGWHAILTGVYKITHWDTHKLVLFSVISLFVLFSLVPIVLMKRPEAWVLSLLVIVVAYPNLIHRLLLGRPYIVMMSVVLAIGFLWRDLRGRNFPYKTFVILALAIAASVWIHCGWYLFIFLVFWFFIAREWRAGILLSIAVVIGVSVGAMLTGHPFLFLKQTLEHVFLAFGTAEARRMLVSEFQPASGDFHLLIIIALMLMWRGIRGRWSPKAVDNPIFLLAASCWALGFFTCRIWIDMGIAATITWIAQEFQEFLESAVGFFSLKRLLLTVALLAILYLAVTNDIYSRWSENRPKGYLSCDNAEEAKWMPDDGGIIYSDTMDIFYQTFYKNPHANWRYVLGFEPGLMPPDDLAIYRNIQSNYRAFSSFEPWVKKMRPQDRLIIRHMPGQEPKIEGLEWQCASGQAWIGRLKRDEKKAEK